MMEALEARKFATLEEATEGGRVTLVLLSPADKPVAAIDIGAACGTLARAEADSGVVRPLTRNAGLGGMEECETGGLDVGPPKTFLRGVFTPPGALLTLEVDGAPVDGLLYTLKLFTRAAMIGSGVCMPDRLAPPPPP
jgi:hypothetical protein